MPTITIDFSKVESSEPIPVSNQPVIVDQIELRESKSSEHHYLNWKLVISDGPFTGRVLYMITSLAPKALFKLQEVMAAFGYDSKGSVPLEVDDATNLLISPPLVGRPAMAAVTQETYENQIRNRVDKVSAITGAPNKAQAVTNGSSRKLA